MQAGPILLYRDDEMEREGGKISVFLIDSLPSTLFLSLHSFSVHICSRNELHPLKHKLYKFQILPLPLFEWNAVSLSVSRDLMLHVIITGFEMTKKSLNIKWRKGQTTLMTDSLVFL